jgi:hypothetical protein
LPHKCRWRRHSASWGILHPIKNWLAPARSGGMQCACRALPEPGLLNFCCCFCVGCHVLATLR